jgi:circadian clock protein KaiC
MSPPSRRHKAAGLPKTPTGILGFDDITGGGLPKGRPTLLCGGTGCGKTLMAMEFLVRGITDYGEPGAFVAFEENTADLAINCTSLGFDLDKLQAQKKLILDHVRVDPGEIQETGEYNLDGLFIRLAEIIDRIKARRIVLDTCETLFAALSNHLIVRSELQRLFRWLKERGVTAIITAERGQGQLTRFGLEEYVADCVVLLDARLSDQISTRYLRVIKYRGSAHGANEYPFLVGEAGLSVLPITSVKLAYDASSKRVSSGLRRLDTMLGGKGFFEGSSVLITGTAGTGKSTFAATFAHSICRNGGRCLYFPFEESPAQIIRNMRSVGINLQRSVDEGQLRFHAVSPTATGLEDHLLTMQNLVTAFHPKAVVIDPISNLITIGDPARVRRILSRLVAFLKSRNVTIVTTCLTRAEETSGETNSSISSTMDACIVLTNLESNGERNRGLYILKCRGLAHSNQLREFKITNNGLELMDVYGARGQVLVGSARIAHEQDDRALELSRQQSLTRHKREIAAQRQALQAQMIALRAQRQALQAQMIALRAQVSNADGELRAMIAEERERLEGVEHERRVLSSSRHADAMANGASKPRGLK